MPGAPRKQTGRRAGKGPAQPSRPASPARRAAFAVLLRLEPTRNRPHPPRPDTLLARLEDAAGAAPERLATGRSQENSSSACCAGGAHSTTPSTATRAGRSADSTFPCAPRSGSASTSFATSTGCRPAPRSTSPCPSPPLPPGPARRASSTLSSVPTSGQTTPGPAPAGIGGSICAPGCHIRTGWWTVTLGNSEPKAPDGGWKQATVPQRSSCA